MLLFLFFFFFSQGKSVPKFCESYSENGHLKARGRRSEISMGEDTRDECELRLILTLYFQTTISRYC